MPNRRRRTAPTSRSSAPRGGRTSSVRRPCASTESAETCIAAPIIARARAWLDRDRLDRDRSEEHTSELQSLMRISYAVFCLKKKTKYQYTQSLTNSTIIIHQQQTNTYNN